MTIRRAAIAAALLLAGSATVTVRSQSPAAARADQAYTSAATAILVDVVVRDRRGRPVIDLTADDFEVYEDGVNQKVDTFTRVSRGGGIGVGVAWKAGAATTSVMTSRPAPDGPTDQRQADDTTVALVFDHLSTESLRLAQRATLDYVPMTGDSEVRVGVFATDPGFRVIQPYTADRAVVRIAVAKVTPSGTASEERKGERAEELQARRRQLETQNATAISAAGSTSGPALARNSSEIGARETEVRLMQTELNMLRSFDNLDRDHRGYDTSGALLGVVESLSMLPGRKTIVFFSEGLPVSPALAARLDAIIEAANRANVTTYAIDAHGLRTNTAARTMKKEMDGFVEDRFGQLSSGSDRTNQPLTMAFERVEDTLNLDSRTGLAKLAEDTGGFLVENSNDLGAAFRRIDEDNQFHYLLTYAPRNATFDGRFRAIRVKVRRPSTQVFARRGYRAVRATGTSETARFEAPALAILDGGRLPNLFPVHAGSFSFPDPLRPGLTPLLVHVRTDALHFAVDDQKSTYSSQAAIVVRVRTGAGQEVQKLSQRYQLSGDARDVEAARQGDIIFYRELDLEPGVYTIESVVFDAGARRGSARITTLNVPAVDRDRPSLSSLVLVNRIEETSDTPPASSSSRPPLFVGSRLLYPNLGEPVSKAAVGELPFYFALYGSVPDARVMVQLSRNGQPLAEAAVPLAAATGSRVQHIGRLPVAGLPVGTYELRIAVRTAGRELTRTAFFTLVD
jgi:VWFA-related protein